MMSGLITHVNKLFISITKNAALQTYSPYSTTAVTSVRFACFKYFIKGYTVLYTHTSCTIDPKILQSLRWK